MAGHGHSLDESQDTLSVAIGKMFSTSPSFANKLAYAYNESSGWYFQGLVTGITCPGCLEDGLSIWRDRENPYNPGSFWNTVYACVDTGCGVIFPQFDLDLFRRLILHEYLPSDELSHEEKLLIADRRKAKDVELGIGNASWSCLQEKSLQSDVESGAFDLNGLSEKYGQTFKSLRQKIEKIRFPRKGSKWHRDEKFLVEERYLAGDTIDQISKDTQRTPDSIYKRIKDLQRIEIDAYSAFKPGEIDYLHQYLSNPSARLYDASLYLGRPIGMLEEIARNHAVDAFPSIRLEAESVRVNEPRQDREIYGVEEDEKILKLSRTIYLKLGFIPIIEDDSAFQTSGWAYDGVCKNMPCIQCGVITDLEIWRKKIEDSKYRYWAITCTECEKVSNLMDCTPELRKKFRTWSSGNPTDENTSGQVCSQEIELQKPKKTAKESTITDGITVEFQKRENQNKRRKRKGILANIKEILSLEFGIDFCFIQSGIFFNCIEENAFLSNELWGWKINNETKRIPFTGTSIHRSTPYLHLQAQIEELNLLGTSWAIVERTEESMRGHVREVVASSIEEAIGFKFD
jgi:hypothetical protein